MSSSTITLCIRETGAADTRAFLCHVLRDGEPVMNNLNLSPEQAQQACALSQQFNELFETFFDCPPNPPAMDARLHTIGAELFNLWLARVWPTLSTKLPVGALRTLVIASDVGDVLNLPWELLRLTNEASSGFIGFNQNFAVRRLPRAAIAIPKFHGQLRAKPLRVLFVACAPRDQDGLDFEREEEFLLRALANAGPHVVFESSDMGSYDELQDLLNEFQPHIVHMNGHGLVKDDGLGYFYFEDESGASDPRSSHELRTLFAASGVQCVFVSGCQTGKAPPIAALGGICQGLVSEEVPFAIGWAASIADTVATDFARAFYKTLAAGQPINRAMTQARLAIRQQCDEMGYPAWTLPVLYAASDQTLLFDARLPADPPQRRPAPQAPLGSGIGYAEQFIGRRRLIQDLLPKLRTGQLSTVVLTGLGGAGKSTLATRLARKLEGHGFTPLPLPSPASAPLNTATLLERCGQAFLDAGLRESYQLLRDPSIAALDRLRHIVTTLNRTRFVVVLDNFESNLDEQTNRIVNPEVAAFYQYLLTNLTGDARTGSRLIVTARYLPADASPLPPRARHEPLEDFAARDFFKFLMRDAAVERRYHAGELRRALLDDLHRLCGGTPRFLEQIRKILRDIDHAELARELNAVVLPAAAAPGQLQQARDEYCEQIFTARLFSYLSPTAQRALCRAAVFNVPINFAGLAAVADLPIEQARQCAAEWQQRALAFPERERAAPDLWAIYGLLRGWLLAPARISQEERIAAHRAAAAFLREMVTQHREGELGMQGTECLVEARTQLLVAGDVAEAREVADRVSTFYVRSGLYAALRQLNLDQLIYQQHPIPMLWIGRSFFEVGDYAKAREWYEQALNVAGDDNPKDAAIVWNELASIDLQARDYAAAREKFSRSLEIKQQIGDRASEAATWHQFASIDLEVGDYTAAREKFNRALEIDQQTGNRAGEAATWHQLATIDLEVGDYTVAREKFSHSLEINQQIGNRASEAAIWHQLALIDLNVGDYAAAREKCNRALEIKQQIGNRAGEAATWHQLATIDLEVGDYTAAREKSNCALEIEQQIGDRVGEAITFYQLGVIGWRTGRRAEGAQLAALCYVLLQPTGHSTGQIAAKYFAEMAEQLGYDEERRQTLLAEVAAAYQQDRGASLVRAAFGEG